MGDVEQPDTDTRFCLKGAHGHRVCGEDKSGHVALKTESDCALCHKSDFRKSDSRPFESGRTAVPRPTRSSAEAPLELASHVQPILPKAKFAARALHRLQPKMLPVLEALSPSHTENQSRTSRGLQHIIHSLADEADADLTFLSMKRADCPSRYP